MASGTYTLLLTLDRPATVEVGALGERQFESGAYAYTGSALGPGGFARVERHRRLAESDDGTRHWHVDYLLSLAELRAVFTAEAAAVECEVARAMSGDRVAGFGATDCDCDSHLAFDPSASALETCLAALYEAPIELETG
jgi:endonuclease-3